jgi:hypothetical protein
MPSASTLLAISTATVGTTMRAVSSPARGLATACSGRLPPISRRARSGPLVAEATREGYRASAAGSQPRAYHGYRYRILAAQGPDAPGGARSYVVDGRMIGGFAVLAYPVNPGVSGVMSFIVNHEGIVYQKNLGRNGEAVAAKMQRFNPAAGWTRVPIE